MITPPPLPDTQNILQTIKDNLINIYMNFLKPTSILDIFGAYNHLPSNIQVIKGTQFDNNKKNQQFDIIITIDEKKPLTSKLLTKMAKYLSTNGYIIGIMKYKHPITQLNNNKNKLVVDWDNTDTVSIFINDETYKDIIFFVLKK